MFLKEPGVLVMTGPAKRLAFISATESRLSFNSLTRNGCGLKRIDLPELLQLFVDFRLASVIPF
jgi:hypothetical protein